MNELEVKLIEAIDWVQGNFCDRMESGKDCQELCARGNRCAMECLKNLKAEVQRDFDPLFQCASCGLDWCLGKELARQENEKLTDTRPIPGLGKNEID